MSLEMVPRQRLEQRMHLSQQMLQNLELLLLPALDLRSFVEKQLEENPVLEEEERLEPAADADEETPEEAAREEMLARVEDEWLESERRTRRSESTEDAERRMEMLNNCASSAATLKDHLLSQLLLLELSEETRMLCTHVVEHLDESGFLKASIEDMVTSLPEDALRTPLDVLADKLRAAVAVVQSLEPRGIGARSLKECLLLQLDPADVLAPVLRKFIESHLEDVGANRLPHIVRSVMADPAMMKDLGREDETDPGVVLDEVKHLIAEVARLNPYPGSRYSTDKPCRVFPEVVVRRVDEQLEIVLEDGWLPAIAVNRAYEDLVKARSLAGDERALAARLANEARLSKADRQLFSKLAAGKRLLPKDQSRCSELAAGGTLPPQDAKLLAAISQGSTCSRTDREFIKRKVEAGRKLIAAIEQRRGTLYRITEQILARQAAFFEEGIEHLRPLRMQEVADALGIHLSTVSRAVSEKWMETPHGILPFRFFFASAAPSAATGVEGGTRPALLDKVRDILESEDRTKPHSDLEIARILNREFSIPAARRTVAKYREQLRFPSAKLRKCY